MEVPSRSMAKTTCVGDNVFMKTATKDLGVHHAIDCQSVSKTNEALELSSTKSVMFERQHGRARGHDLRRGSKPLPARIIPFLVIRRNSRRSTVRIPHRSLAHRPPTLITSSVPSNPSLTSLISSRVLSSLPALSLRCAYKPSNPCLGSSKPLWPNRLPRSALYRRRRPSRSWSLKYVESVASR